MSNLKHKLKMLLAVSILASMPIYPSIAGIAFSDETLSSLSISSNRTENSYHYLIEIYIEGVETSSVTFESDFQTLYLLAQRSGMITETAIAGSQIIRLAFNFPANANLKNYYRVNTPNRILITVPKST